METRGAAALSPAVLNLVRRHGIDPREVRASGPKNNILKGDVLAYLASPRPRALELASTLSSSDLVTNLVLTAEALQTLRVFASQVDLDSRMTEQLLAKALCHAAAQLASPELVAEIHYSGHDESLQVQLGGPLSRKLGPGSEAPFLAIDFAAKGGRNAAPLAVSIQRRDGAKLVEVHCRQTGFDLVAFMHRLSINISDPHAMLL